MNQMNLIDSWIKLGRSEKYSGTKSPWKFSTISILSETSKQITGFGATKSIGYFFHLMLIYLSNARTFCEQPRLSTYSPSSSNFNKWMSHSLIISGTNWNWISTCLIISVTNWNWISTCLVRARWIWFLDKQISL